MKSKLRNIVRNVLSNHWARLYNIEYEFLFKDGSWKKLQRESYDRGDGACVLLYNKEKSTVILTRQFRMPIYHNTPADGMSIEVCAGALEDNEDPKEGIIREIEEEVGYCVKNIEKVIESYMSPGAVTEQLFMFVAEYSEAMKVNEGGGLETEGEEIEVLEMTFEKALQMMGKGEIKDAKTIMLLQYAQIHKLL